MATERGGFLGPAGKFLRIDPGEHGQGMWGNYPVHFDRDAMQAHEEFELSKPDDKFTATHVATGHVLGVDATQYSPDVCAQFYTMPATARGPYESFQMYRLPSGAVIAVVEYEANGRRYVSAPLTWVKA